MEKNPSRTSFGSVDTHNAQRASDYTKIIVGELVNRAKPFQLASPMQWKHAIFVARVPRHLHLVENIWSFFRGITLWSIWIECNDLIFKNVRWDGCRIQKAIWDVGLDYGRVAWRWCVKKISRSPTFEHKIKENFDKVGKKSCHLCEGRQVH
jgi:hypothetical protein